MAPKLAAVARPADSTAPERRAARVVLVGPGARVLLLSGHDPSDPAAPPFWIVPGGGAEAGETDEEAGRREVHEETGAILGDLGPVVWLRRADFTFDGQYFRQREAFYVVRTPEFDVLAVAWTEAEDRFITGWRWWALDELAATPEVIYPTDLAALVADWLVAGPPAQPRRIG